jgi:glycosyltransferase involved in cell wall biosynthesis
MKTSKMSVGLFLSRPDRSFYMARKLRERGFHVVNYNPQQYGEDPYIRLRPNFVSALFHLLVKTNHDVYFTGLSFTPSFSLYLNKQLRRKPYVFNLTGVDWQAFHDRSVGKPCAQFFEHRFYPFLLERILSGASRIVSNSKFLESRLAERFPEHRGRLMTIYNGIEFDRYSSGQRLSCRASSEDQLVLLCATTLNYRNKSKGLELVMEAFGKVWGERKNARLLIAAKFSHPMYSEWAEEYIRVQPWRDSVTLLYNHTNMPDLLASSDLFVFATPQDSNDSLPRVLLEAQSAGLPVVTTNTSGCPEIVCDGITGFVVPYAAGELADRILQLGDQPALRKEMGREAQKRIAETFNWDRMVDQYINVFSESAA